ncbi:MAG: hypothetical protein RL660_1709 [Bacteroidota bacterium]|jgi:hypothetical protein
MTITYTIGENDYLSYQLFAASQSERIKKKRRRSRLMTPIGYIILALLFFLKGSVTISIGLLCVALLWFLVYPIWESRHYVNHYKNYIKENYHARFDKPGTLEINKDYCIAKDDASESKFLTTEIAQIQEIPSIILIALKGGQSIILPKEKI